MRALCATVIIRVAPDGGRCISDGGGVLAETFDTHAGPAWGLDSAIFRVLAEALPVPVVVYDAVGSIQVANEQADSLLVRAVEGGPARVVAFDGSDLWDVLPAVLENHGPSMQYTGRFRLASGKSGDVTFAVIPSWDRRGSLTSAIVMALSMPEESSDTLGSTRSSARDPREAIDAEVRMLAETLHADIAYVAEIASERPARARTWSYFKDGVFEAPLEWRTAGTPGGTVIPRSIVCYPSGVRERFSDDTWLAEQDVEAFAAVSVGDPDGRKLAVLAVLWRKPLSDPTVVRAVLTVAATRMSPWLWHLRSQRQLLESEERYSSIFQHAHLPMIVVDPASSQIVEANTAACHFYGYPYHELTTMSVFQIDTMQPEPLHAEIQRALDGSRDYFQFKHRTARGAVKDVEVYAGPITVGGRRMLYEIIHDVSERRRAEDELEHYRQNLEKLVEQRTADLMRMNAELQQVTRARDFFFANMSHELRTPLYTIIGLTDLLLGGYVEEPEERDKQLQMMNEAGRGLLELVSDVLDISQLQTGQVECEAEEFDVVELAESTLFSMRHMAEDKGLGVEFHCAERPVHIVSDRFKIQQILMNLLSNAVKYTDGGTIAVDVARRDDGIAVTVADTGRGIASDEIPHIFEEFRQMSRGDSGTHAGTGLGLALSRRLADVIGATLSVRSTPGEGSRFTLFLPVERRAPVEEQVAEDA